VISNGFTVAQIFKILCQSPQGKPLHQVQLRGVRRDEQIAAPDAWEDFV